MGAWTPGDVIEAGKLLLQFCEFVLIIMVLVGFRGLRKEVDGRLSQLIDLVARLSGFPNRRFRDDPVDTERRTKRQFRDDDAAR